MKYFLLLFMVFFEFCTPVVEEKRVFEGQDEPIAQVTKKPTKNDQDRKVVVNDSFAYKPFEEKITVSNIANYLPGDHKRSTKAITNQHTGRTDTLITYEADSYVFQLFKGNQKSFLQKAMISNRNIRLSKDITVGMLKSDFLGNLNITEDLPGNILIITDSEEYSKHTFYFEGEILKKIEINPGFD